MSTYPHAVWPTPILPVGDGHWSTATRERWQDQYRPRDYGGGRYSLRDYNHYTRTKDMVFVQRWYWQKWGMVPHGVVWG